MNRRIARKVIRHGMTSDRHRYGTFDEAIRVNNDYYIYCRLCRSLGLLIDNKPFKPKGKIKHKYPRPSDIRPTPLWIPTSGTSMFGTQLPNPYFTSQIAHSKRSN